MTRIELEPVDRVRVTILMDNVTDVLIPDQGPVTRFNAPKALADSAPRVPARFATEGVPDGLIAEHGFFVGHVAAIASAKACRAASQDVAVRRAYRRCVRNVSAR